VSKPINWTVFKRYVAAIGLTALAMAWLAPLESSVWLKPGDRYLFWFATVSAGWLQMIIVAHGVRASFGTERLPGWVLLIISAGIGAIPITFEVRYLWELLKLGDAELRPYWQSYITVLFINLNFSLLQWWLVERWSLFSGDEKTSAELSEGTSTAIPTVEMLNRRPDNLTGTILCMQMEDHYLRVYGENGEGIVLHRMADAAKELNQSDGMQIHRSWWVARHAIANKHSANRRSELELTNGLRVPIGRSFRSKLKEAGWI
jgi:hypothetical protein